MAPVSPPAVVIVGAPRSGTTLLYKALCLHRRAVWLSNLAARWPGTPWLAVANRLASRLVATRRAVWFGREGNAYTYGQPRRVVARGFPTPAEGEAVFDRFLGPAGGGPTDAAGIDGLRRYLAGLRRAAAGRGVEAVLVTKHIHNNRRLPDLLRALPGARVVHLVRDGRDVACSLHDVAWWPRQPLWWTADGVLAADWEAAGGDAWTAQARLWAEEVRVVREATATLAPGTVREVRYEELVAEPRRTLGDLARFAGLGATGGWLDEVGQVVRAGTPANRWRTLEPTTVARIEQIQGAELARWGYR